MNLVDKKVFVIGTRKSNNDAWETSGATYGNLVDVNAIADWFRSFRRTAGT